MIYDQEYPLLLRHAPYLLQYLLQGFNNLTTVDRLLTFYETISLSPWMDSKFLTSNNHLKIFHYRRWKELEVKTTMLDSGDLSKSFHLVFNAIFRLSISKRNYDLNYSFFRAIGAISSSDRRLIKKQNKTDWIYRNILMTICLHVKRNHEHFI